MGGRLGAVRRAADIPVGIAESKGKFTAFLLDSDIQALLRRAPRKSFYPASPGRAGKFEGGDRKIYNSKPDKESRVSLRPFVVNGRGSTSMCHFRYQFGGAFLSLSCAVFIRQSLEVGELEPVEI